MSFDPAAGDFLDAVPEIAASYATTDHLPDTRWVEAVMTAILDAL
jgi:hypothetical protein